MINLIEKAKEQNGVITLEQLIDALEELKAIVEADKPYWYDRGLWHQTTIYDGEFYLLNKILNVNKL